MNPEAFIQALKLVVSDAARNGVLRNLEYPPGRQPAERLVRASQFYKSLSEGQQEQIAAIVEHAIHQAVFGFLCVIDGVRAIESGPDKGRLELRYIREGEVILNAPSRPFLYELYNG